MSSPFGSVRPYVTTGIVIAGTALLLVVPPSNTPVHLERIATIAPAARAITPPAAGGVGQHMVLFTAATGAHGGSGVRQINGVSGIFG